MRTPSMLMEAVLILGSPSILTLEAANNDSSFNTPEEGGSWDAAPCIGETLLENSSTFA